MKNSNLLIAISAITLVAACSDNRPPEEIVAERAQARWDAMVERDFEKVWEFFPPGLREQTSQAVFAVEYARRPIRWDSARVTAVDCEKRRCEISTEVSYTVAGGPATLAGMQNSRSVKGVWIEIDGEWWYSDD
ncbi:hypothetical protein [Marinobacter sp.]|uniref:hypothetical protein n=1 Tax=Marinobacter sp. TaxID=50741 RepID=UPI002B46379E|nr:hypothetical protein [Marinobacter sp.]HKK57574.1 hypothetical protein [Marinobacter sp.]